jgi:2-C-methyl-D-erythritol 4-phosphate cytidylyltransferase
MFARVKPALVIPAAGSGVRLARGIPKALVLLDGVPLLRRTLERLASSCHFLETVVLAPPDELERFRAATGGAPSSLGPLRVLAGGATRQLSVAAGVAALAGDADVVCVHDAARPLVSHETVRAVLEAAFASGAATAASRPIDSVREDRPGGGSVALDRAHLWLVETPQAFDRRILERAHAQAAQAHGNYTDDASLVEAIGQQIRIVGSVGRNIKVTLESDLALAASLLHLEAARP